MDVGTSSDDLQVAKQDRVIWGIDEWVRGQTLFILGQVSIFGTQSNLVNRTTSPRE